MESIVQAFFENSEKYAQKTAIVFDGKEISYSALAKRVRVFASALKSRSIKKGNKVLIEADNLIDFFTAFLGCMLVGAVVVPIEKNISIYRLQEIMISTKPSLVFMKNNGESYKSFLNGEDSFKKISFPKLESDAAIVSTTGTTGNPVLVCHTNKSMLACAQNLAFGVEIDEKTVLYTNIAFNLASGYRRVFCALYVGATSVISNKDLDLSKLCEDINKYDINHLAFVSANLSYLFSDSTYFDTFSNIKTVEAVTGVLPYSTVLGFKSLLPNVTLYNVYGATEAGCVLVNNTSENFSEGCIGKPSKNATVYLVDENENEITSSGKYGYIAVKGDMNMKGYYKKKALTDKVIKGDTLSLNDIAYFDENGYFYFVSRVGEIINVDGRKVIPSEIEQIAMKVDGVKDCACVAKEDKRLGQVPALYVVCDKAFDMDKLKTFLDENLENYRVPKEIIKIDKIPKTPTGKIMRKSLWLK